MGPGKEVTIDVIPEERGGVCNGSPAMADVCDSQPLVGASAECIHRAHSGRVRGEDMGLR